MNNEIMVSVCCLVYNHEKYLRQCLDGFIMQKTNFKFEVLVHDDASTDGSADIIREYEKKYPDIIKPIYQKENQYSKGVKISWTFQYPRAKGKYIALCEGDDYWIDPNKLQIQFDWMESHSDYTLCVHEAIKINLFDNIEEYYTKIDKSGYVAIETILENGAIFATNSCFFKTEIMLLMPKSFTTFGFGDHQVIIFNTLKGKCYYISKPMSVYNWGTEGSWTNRVLFDSKKRAKNCLEMISLMKVIDEYSCFRYTESIQKKIDKTEFNYHLAHGDFLKVKKKKYRVFYEESAWNPQKEAFLNRFPFLKKLRGKNK